jgi:hypothetical protein
MKNFIFTFFFFFISTVYAQFEKIETFQKNLIEDEVTANNVALIFKKGKVQNHPVENTPSLHGKAIDNNTLFPI